MRVTINHNGFHGWKQATFILDKSFITPDPDNEARPNYYYAQVSLAVGKRLNTFVCGKSDCRCGEQIADCISYRNYDGSGFAMIRYTSNDGGRHGVIRGRYPQSS